MAEGIWILYAHIRYCIDCDCGACDCCYCCILLDESWIESESSRWCEGKEIYKEVEKHIEEPLKSTIQKNIEFVSGLTKQELQTFIYATFPDYIIDSEVRMKIQRNRVKNAISMLMKEKVTASQAAKVAGMGYNEFENHLNTLKIRWKS